MSKGQASLRREGHISYQVNVFDISPHGCKVEIIERPNLGDRVWIKFAGLEPLHAMVCWVEGPAAGLEFETKIHPAVFEMLLKRLR